MSAPENRIRVEPGRSAPRETNVPAVHATDLRCMRQALASFFSGRIEPDGDDALIRLLFRRLLDAAQRCDTRAILGYAESSRQLLLRYGEGEHWGPVNMASINIEMDLQMQLWGHVDQAVTRFCLEVLWAYRMRAQTN